MALRTETGARKYLAATERDGFLREADVADRKVRTLRSRSTPPSSAIISRPVLVLVSAHGSASDRTCPPATTPSVPRILASRMSGSAVTMIMPRDKFPRSTAVVDLRGEEFGQAFRRFRCRKRTAAEGDGAMTRAELMALPMD